MVEAVIANLHLFFVYRMFIWGGRTIFRIERALCEMDFYGGNFRNRRKSNKAIAIVGLLASSKVAIVSSCMVWMLVAKH